MSNEIKTPEVAGLVENSELTLSKAEKKALAKVAKTDAVSPRISRGRFVDYHHHGTDLTALVTNVAVISPDITVVCLTVFDSLGTTFGTTGVKEGSEDGEWSWPVRES